MADGFEWGLGNQNQPLSVDDNYPAGVYTYSGTVAGNPITITLTITKLSTADDITSFGCGLTGEVDTIGAGTVGVAVPSGTDVTNLIPTIVVSAGATVAPTSGTAENFTEPVNYTVTAQDGLTNQVYTVTVTVAPAPVVPAPVSTGGGGGGGAGGNAFYYGIASSSSTSSTSSASSASFASLVSSTILTSNEESSSSSFSSSSISVQQSSSSSSSSSFSSSSVSTINNIPVGAGAAALTNSGNFPPYTVHVPCRARESEQVRPLLATEREAGGAE